MNVLQKHGLLRPDSPVKNIALVLGKLYHSTGGWPAGEEEPELAWRGAMIKEARHHDLVFKGAPYTIETLLQEDGLSGPQNGRPQHAAEHLGA